MAQRYGFFNALNVGGTYDRKYNANDYCDNLAVIISNGVLRSEADDLKVTANGLTCSVSSGRAFIKGHFYYNDTAYSFSPAAAPTVGKRYDRIVLRLNTDVSARNIALVYLTGTSSNTPVRPALTRDNTTYDLCLADIYIDTNASTVTVTDKRSDTSVCGWIYSTSGDNSFFTSLDGQFSDWFSEKKNTLSSVTLFQKYEWRTVLAAAGNSVTFSIAQWDSTTCFLEVYVNGFLEYAATDYSVSNSTVTFTNTLLAGTEVVVKVYKSIDGTGINSVSSTVSSLQSTVSSLSSESKYIYTCTGTDDNISLSQIAQALYSGTIGTVNQSASAFLTALGGTTYLQNRPAEARITIKVLGSCGVSTAYSGAGTSSNPYKWFMLGSPSATAKKIVFDFSNCPAVYMTGAANKYNIAFYGTDMYIKNLSAFALGRAATVYFDMFGSPANNGTILIDDCMLVVSTTAIGVVGRNGTFTNCTTYAYGSTGYCFSPKSDCLATVIGGKHHAYTSSNSSNSAVFYVSSSAANGVIMASSVNCPTVAAQGYYQKKLSVANAGHIFINGCASTLTTDGSYNETVGLIAINKP